LCFDKKNVFLYAAYGQYSKNILNILFFSEKINIQDFKNMF
jgi:hypothetical protein